MAQELVPVPADHHYEDPSYFVKQDHRLAARLRFDRVNGDLKTVHFTMPLGMFAQEFLKLKDSWINRPGVEGLTFIEPPFRDGTSTREAKIIAEVAPGTEFPHHDPSAACIEMLATFPREAPILERKVADDIIAAELKRTGKFIKDLTKGENPNKKTLLTVKDGKEPGTREVHINLGVLTTTYKDFANKPHCYGYFTYKPGESSCAFTPSNDQILDELETNGRLVRALGKDFTLNGKKVEKDNSRLVFHEPPDQVLQGFKEKNLIAPYIADAISEALQEKEKPREAAGSDGGFVQGLTSPKLQGPREL